MSTAELMKQLHDKATRGITLSIIEQVQLDAWYTQQDQEESALLTQTPPPQTLVALQTQIDTTVARLLAVTQRLQELEKHNEALRRDIAALQQRLPPSSPVQSA
jgi:predicted  nucleic acid-binding Zn-ribbon protein